MGVAFHGAGFHRRIRILEQFAGAVPRDRATATTGPSSEGVRHEEREQRGGRIRRAKAASIAASIRQITYRKQTSYRALPRSAGGIRTRTAGTCSRGIDPRELDIS